MDGGGYDGQPIHFSQTDSSHVSWEQDDVGISSHHGGSLTAAALAVAVALGSGESFLA